MSILVHFPLHTSIDLSEPVDVYSDWIDACELANQWSNSCHENTESQETQDVHITYNEIL